MKDSRICVKYITAAACIIFLTAAGYALQGSYLYTSMSFWRGWNPYSAVVDGGKTGICGCEGRATPEEIDKMGNLEYGLCIDKCLLTSFVSGCLFEEASMTPWDNLCTGAGVNPERRCEVDPNNCMPDIAPPYYGLVVKVTIPEDVKLVASDGSVLGDEVCAGERFTLQRGVVKGEWWQDGGHQDSPPIYWVNNVEEVVDRILDYHKKTTTSIYDVCRTTKPADGYVDPVSGLTVYSTPISNKLAGWSFLENDNIKKLIEGLDAFANLTGSFICSLKPENIELKGIKYDKGYYLITGPDTANFSTNSVVECMYYYYGGEGAWTPLSVIEHCKEGYQTYKVPTIIQAGPDATVDDWNTQNIKYNSKTDFFKVGNISLKKTLKIVSPTEAHIELHTTSTTLSEGGFVRILARNTGDAEARIVKASITSGNLITCDSEKISPNGVVECLFHLNSLESDIKADITYEYSSCGRINRATASKTLIRTVNIKPEKSEQVYLMKVHGDCENTYYACSQTTGEADIGYRCMKNPEKLYTEASGRLNLEYRLNNIPTDAEIITAKLRLTLKETNKKQNLEIHTTKQNIEEIKCTPGGDICTKPYCIECKPLYNPETTKISDIEINNPGRYSIDLTNIVKQKQTENKTVTIQIKNAEEDLWPVEGETSCNTENQWIKKDATINIPEIEIKYRQK